MVNIVPNIRSSVDRLRDEFNNTLDRLGNWGRETREGGSINLPGLFSSIMPTMPGLPAIEMEEDDTEVRVRAELPGLEKDDFKVELTGDRLTIRGEKKNTREEKSGNLHHSEVSYGAFSRSLTLPAEVDPGKVEANYKNGVLTIRLPKTEHARAKPIEIKTD